MTPQTLVNTLEFLLAFALIVWLFYGPWQRYVVDVVRQNLFEIRDEMFLLAADGRLEFNSSLYLEVRRQYNAMIRYAHTTSWTHVLALLSYGIDKQKPSGRTDVFELIGNIQDADLRVLLLRRYSRAVELVAASMALRSALLILISMLLFPVGVMAWMLAQPNKWPWLRRVVECDIEESSRTDRLSQRELTRARMAH